MSINKGLPSAADTGRSSGRPVVTLEEAQRKHDQRQEVEEEDHDDSSCVCCCVDCEVLMVEVELGP
jgi:hypothetical protein